MLLYYYDIFKHAPVFMPPIVPPVITKKKQLPFIHFAFSLSISKKCCVVDDCICLLCRQYNAMSEKRKKYAANGMVLHVVLLKNDKNTDERCHHRRNRREKIC
jgi:hypothetical protein